MQEFIQQAQNWVQLLGPNIYLQAVAIALIFLVIGKFADFVISRLIAKLISRSKTDIDDNLADPQTPSDAAAVPGSPGRKVKRL